MKLIKFVHVIPLKIDPTVYAVWNSLWMRLMFTRNPNINEEDLIRSKIAFSEQENNNKLQEIRIAATNLPIGVTYLILSQSCNLICKYCYLGESTQNQGQMSCQTIQQALHQMKKIFETNGAKKPDIVLYGGEPLLNRRGVFFAVNYSKRIIPDSNLIINTNGTLIDEGYAKLFSDNNVNVCISLDGDKKEHDLFRIDRNGNGSFDRVIQAIKLLKEFNVKINISCTVTQRNAFRLSEIANFFMGDLKVDNIDFNLLLGNFPSPEEMESYAEKGSEAVLNVHKKFAPFGFPVDKVMRIVRPISTGTVSFNSCAGCGQQIVFAPDGRVNPCQGNLNNINVFNKKDDPNNETLWNEWRERTPFNIPECLDCEVLSACGGGCPYSAKERDGNIFALDKVHCALAKKTLRFVIEEMWQKLRKKWFAT